MAIEKFIPTVWTSAIFQGFHSALAIIPILNRNYEGEIASGNTVKITSITTPVVQNYKTNRTLTIDSLSDTSQSLVIDQEKAFSFKVDDVDRVQAAGSFDPVTQDAGAALAEDAENFMIGLLKTNGTSAGTSAITSFSAAYGALVAIRTAMSKAKIPQANRYAVVSPEFAALLLSESSKLTSVNTSGSSSELRNGVLGDILGFTVVEHPLLTHTSNRPAVIALHGPSVAFVSQISKTEAGRMETAFADYVRSLNVYGAKILRPEAVQTWLPTA
jgi:hypothetical protein